MNPGFHDEPSGRVPRELRRQLEGLFPGRLQWRVPLSRMTTLRVGGPAEILLEPASVAEVCRIVEITREWNVPLWIIGAGSNVLVGDRGLPGVVLRFGEAMARWRVCGRGERFLLEVQAGLPLRRLMREAVRGGWGGVESLVGIPGTVGGALAMNAGTPDSAVGDRVEWIRWVDREGRVHQWEKEVLCFRYRTLVRPQGILVEAGLGLTRTNQEGLRARLRERMRRRLRTQPLGFSSAGSVFRNPPGDHAGRIIDSLGLKGLRVGRAQVSSIHANFIVNLGGASAEEVIRLIREVQRRVAEATGIRLEPEIRIMGERL